MLRDADGQRDQFLVLFADGAFGHGGLGQLAEALHGLGLRFAKRAELGTDVLDQAGVSLIRYPGHPGRKRFLCKIAARDSGVAFDLKAKGFGILARGVGYYAALGSTVLMQFLAHRNNLDNEFLIKLSTAARLCGEAFLSGRITAANQLEIVLSITMQVRDEGELRVLGNQNQS